MPVFCKGYECWPLSARDEAVLSFSLVPELNISEAVAAVGLQFVLLHFCRVLVTDDFYRCKVWRYSFQFKASETVVAGISVGETDLAHAAVLAGMLSGSSPKEFYTFSFIDQASKMCMSSARAVAVVVDLWA